MDITQEPEYLSALASSKKEPHEIQDEEYVPLDVDGSIWEKIEPPLGSYCRSREADRWVGRLTDVSIENIIIDPHRKRFIDWCPKTSWSLLEKARKEYKKFGRILPTVGYKDTLNRVVLIGNLETHRFLVARSLGLKSIKIWVIETENKYALNVNKYIAKALDDNKAVPFAILERYRNNKLGLNSPHYCPTLTDTEVFRLRSPELGDILGALIKYLNGDEAEYNSLKKILSK